jgi:hypothetical protein
MSISTSAHATGEDCFPVQGYFDSAPAAVCTSPVGICTNGQLKGRFAGGYDFVMMQIIDPNDESVPTVSFFTGSSLITTESGMLLGTDTGALDLNPNGHGAFSTLLTLTDGTGDLEGARGYLHIRGNLDFATGVAEGDFKGRICRK